MKRGSILLAIVFTIAIPAIIAWPALRIASSWTIGQEEVRSSYGALRRLAINAINLPSSVAEAAWTDATRKTWNNDNRLLAIVISDSSGTVLYALPEASPFYAESEPDAKGPVYVYPENTVARFNGVIGSGLILDALYVTLRQGELYKPLKDATLSLLALLALTAAWLIAATATDTEKSTGESTGESSKTRPAIDRAMDRAKDSASDPLPDSKTRESGLPDSKARESGLPDYRNPDIPDHLHEFPELMELSSPPASIGFPSRSESTQSADKAGEIELLASEVPLPEKEEAFQIKTSPLDGPRGLYDPETGLGWESYLRERLGAELRRSASFEQDLSILVASLDSATGRTDPNYAVFAKTSRSFFSFNDLAFIFGTKGLAIILPNTDIDQAMRMCEELLRKLALLIQDRSDPRSYLNLFMGLSSRAGRLVEADRLLGEAMAAHRKAREERDTHIIAFRPDPEKFRAYLASQ